MRITLINNKSNIKIFLIFVMIVLLSWLYIRFSDSFDLLIPTLVFLASSIISFILLLNLRIKDKKIEFDRENLYFCQKGFEDAIPLKKISSISMTGIWTTIGVGFINSSQYRMNYLNAFDQEEEIYFTLYWDQRTHFLQLVDLIKSQNPGLQFKNWATNWDPLIYWIKKKIKKRE